MLEIKCPYCHHNNGIEVVTVATNSKSCLNKLADGSLQLDRSHAYYFQVQTQIFVCEVEYCDFCVLCTFPSEANPSIHIERIFPDNDLWASCVARSTHFFGQVFYLSFLASGTQDHHAVTHQSQHTVCEESNEQPTKTDYSLEPSSSASISTVKLYCYCRQPDDGSAEMIGCDNPNCSIEWFHTCCLKVCSIPKGKCTVLSRLSQETRV